MTTPADIAIAKLEEKLAQLEAAFERYQAANEARLREGAATFAEIQHQLRPSLLKVLGIVASAGLVIGGFIWKLSRYPEAEELKQYQQTSASTALSLDRKIQDQGADIREIRGAVERAEERQKALDHKLDEALTRRRR